MKKFAYILLAAAVLASCTKDGGKGRSTVEIPGVPGGFDETFLYMQSCGPSTIDGVWATNLAFQLNASDGRRMHISAMMFHRGEGFTTGTYDFPSTDAGTASGTVQLVSNDHQNVFSGYITAGSATISNSGGDWTVTFHDVVVQLEDGSTKTVSFTYKGLAEKEDVSSWMGGRGPEYGVSSTVEEAIGGEKYTRMGMERRYEGITESGLYEHDVRLAANPHLDDLSVQLRLYTAGKELPAGTYLANTGEALSVEGGVYARGWSGEIIDGGVTLAKESNGMWRLTFNDLRVGQQGGDGETRLARYTGVWTGGGNFYDDTLDPQYPPYITEPQYGGSTTFTLPGGRAIEGVKANGFTVENRVSFTVEAFILPAGSTGYSTDNRVELIFELVGTELTPGTYAFDYEPGAGKFQLTMRYPTFDTGGAVTGSRQSYLSAGTLTVEQSGGEWELTLTDTATNDPALPNFDGAYTGRISFNRQ